MAGMNAALRLGTAHCRFIAIGLAAAWAAGLAAPTRAADQAALSQVQARISLAAGPWCDRAAELGTDGLRRCVLHLSVIDDGPAPAAHAVQLGDVVVLTRSMLSALDEDELAAVLGHEVAHLVLGHGLLRLRDGLARLPLSQLDPKLAQGLLGMQQLLESSQSAPHPQAPDDPRAQEFDADALGLVFAMRAGYAADAGERLFGRVASAVPGWAGDAGTTHPKLPARAQRLAGLATELCRALREGRPLLPGEERLLPQADYRREEAAAAAPPVGTLRCEP